MANQNSLTKSTSYIFYYLPFRSFLSTKRTAAEINLILIFQPTTWDEIEAGNFAQTAKMKTVYNQDSFPFALLTRQTRTAKTTRRIYFTGYSGYYKLLHLHVPHRRIERKREWAMHTVLLLWDYVNTNIADETAFPIQTVVAHCIWPIRNVFSG